MSNFFHKNWINKKMVKHSLLKVLLILNLVFVSFIALQANVEAAQVTPQQIEQFKKLPPSQQQAMAKAMGIDINAFKQQMLSNSTRSPISESSQNNLVYPRGTQFDALGNPISPEQLAADELAKKEAEAVDEVKEPQPFGYDVFANAPATFAPDLEIAIPESHIIGSGDKLSIQIFGKENNEYQLTVNREGQVIIPSLGAFNVVGLSFAEMKNFLTAQIKKRIIGVDVVISLAELRSIRVFVLGDAFKPGPYTLNSLSTMTHALFAAGGINDIGSLRNIQLKRAGKLIQTLDLYDLLINGDSSGDQSLQSGDVVFIAPVGKRVTVDGQVRRPAIYELAANESFSDVIKMAGGLLPSAYPKSTIVERYNKNNLRSIINIDLSNPKQTQEKVQAGDYIRVMETGEMFNQSVTIIGAATRPGNYQWQQGEKITDLLPNVNTHLLKYADLNYSLLVREINVAQDIEVYQFSLADIIANKNSPRNLVLQPRDKIVIFSKVAKISDEKLSLDSFAYTQQALFEREKEQAKKKYKQELFWQRYGAEKSKYQVPEDESDKKANELINQSIAQITGGQIEEKLDIRELGLFSRQRLLIPIITQLKRQGSAGEPIQLVEVDGEVKFPSLYPLTKNARVSDLIAAAGGVTESAYLIRSEITRNKVTPRLVKKESLNINLAKALKGEPSDNILLQSKDRVNIHKIPAWSENHTVELRGEFVFPGKYTIRRGETLAELIQKAGGLTKFAYARGSVFSRKKLKQLEQQNLLKLASDLRVEIASKSLSDGKSNLSYKEAKLLLADLTKVTPVGRLVIDLPKVIRDKNFDIKLDDGDVLYIPSKNNSVNVIGQVQVTSSHIYEPGLSAEDYIARSGGVKKRADKERIYVISADGQIKMTANNNWFSASNNDVKAGDTVVVPLDSEYTNNLELWSSVTQIIYNSAVALATISKI
jgi:polysaccharide export outer membrane protein